MTDLETINNANELMSIQIWILGGLVIVLLGMLVYFTRSSFEEIKLLIKVQGETQTSHGNRLTAIETENEGTVNRVTKIEDERSQIDQVNQTMQMILGQMSKR
jgi:hypothetical protein